MRNDRADATGKPSSIKVGDRLRRLRYFARTTPSTDCVPLGGENSVSPTSCAGKYANNTAIVRDREPGRDVQHYYWKVDKQLMSMSSSLVGNGWAKNSVDISLIDGNRHDRQVGSRD